MHESAASWQIEAGPSKDVGRQRPNAIAPTFPDFINYLIDFKKFDRLVNARRRILEVRAIAEHSLALTA
jgi:hypothetical protein